MSTMYKVFFEDACGKALACCCQDAETPDEAETLAQFRLLQLADSGVEEAILAQKNYTQCEVVVRESGRDAALH